MWTEDKIDELTKLWHRGRTAGQIAEVMGISRNAVLGKAHRLGLTGRGTPIETKRARFERVCDRVIEGVNGKHETLTQAAMMVGLDLSVAQWMWNDIIERTHGGDPM